MADGKLEAVLVGVVNYWLRLAFYYDETLPESPFVSFSDDNPYLKMASGARRILEMARRSPQGS